MTLAPQQLPLIDIRPESDVYGTYRRIAYKAWYAIGEFVDNSTENFAQNLSEIEKVDGAGARLTIDITYDYTADTLMVADDANGMDFSELERAIQLNRPPAYTGGRSEFGMGLKMAAIWLGARWKVVTKRLGSTTEYEAEVDVAAIEEYRPESIQVLPRDGMDIAKHYTRIEIDGLYKKFKGRAIQRIKQHLASMYRRDIESGRVRILWNGELLEWDSGPVFVEMLPDGTSQEWKKHISFEVGGLPVEGEVWLRLPGSASMAGMHLLRRGRLVVGGPGEGYKPWDIFKAPNSFQSQRLVGELDLDQWPVTQTKDAFDWEGDLEHEFTQKLRENVADYMEKAANMVDGSEGVQPTQSDGELAGDSTKDSMGPEVAEELTLIETGPPPVIPSLTEVPPEIRAAAENAGNPTLIEIGAGGTPALKVWWLAQDVVESQDYVWFASPTNEELQLFVNLKHPFVTDYLQRDPERLQTYAEMLYVDALVERAALTRGDSMRPQAFRLYKDRFLRHIKRRDQG